MDQVATSSRSNVDNGCTRDYTSEFTTTETFTSKEDLTNWAKKIGRSNNFTIVVLRSDSGKGSKRARVTLGCERSGKYDSRSSSKKTMMSGSKKCGCPFRLMGKKTGDEWQLEVVEGKHNHEARDNGKQGHSFGGRLSKEEKSLLQNMFKEKEKPKKILEELKKSDKHNKSTARTIYNEVQSMKRRKRAEDVNSQLQQFMSKAEEYNFIEKHRTSPKMHTVLDFFLTHPTSLEMLLAFPTVLRIRIIQRDDPVRFLLEIYGVTSTDITFFVGLAILSSKSKSSYEWALNSLRGVMNDNGIAMPDIVFFGIDTINGIQMAEAPVKAIKDVFSTAKLLLSPDSIIEKVMESTRKLSELNLGELLSFQKKWELLVASPTEHDLEQHLMQLRTEFDMHPNTIDYVINTVLKPYEEMFVAAWTDQVMHFGNTEGECDDFYDCETVLDFVNEYLYGLGKVDEVWENIQGFIEKDLAQIKASLEESLENEYDDKCGLSELHGAISTHALELIRNQPVLAKEIDDNPGEYCHCVIRNTHGLPCAHDIAKYKRQGRPIPLACIHSYWRKLDLEPLRKTGEPNVEGRMKRRRLVSEQNSLYLLPDIEESERHSPNAGPSIVPSTQERLPEDNQVNGIPPSKQDEFVGVCPLEFRRHVLEVKDVPRDGHCGFRAIASFMGYPEDDGWVKVREDLENELSIDNSYYGQLFGSERVNKLRDALAYKGGICSQEYWMTMPDMGHIIASCYNVVLMHLSSAQCFTFFPFRTKPTPSSISSTRVIATGYDREHFYQVYLKEDHPIPPPTNRRIHVAADRERIYEQNSTGWATLYRSRMEHFKSSQEKWDPVLIAIASFLLK